jgi:cell wall-active antibiotic response 4TMS protein YvqF/putative adhesin
MSYGRPRGSSVFSGLILIIIGVLLLLHNYRGFELGSLFVHWWPLLLIVWGALKLYERTAARSAGGDPSGSRITPGEVFLVLGLLALVGIVAGVEGVKEHFPDIMDGNTTAIDLDVAPKAVPANARVTIKGTRGDISVRSSSEAEIRVNGKKNIRSWNQRDADRLSGGSGVEIVQNGDGWDVQPSNGDSRISTDMDVVVPSKSAVTVRNEKGDISVSDLGTSVSINSGTGDIDVRGTIGDVNLDMKRGDAKVSSTKGDVRVSGTGESVDVTDASGSFTINGEFVGPIRAEKITKGVRFVSHRTDLTISQLSGHMEAGTGNLEIVDAPGNVILRTHEEEINVENPGAKVKIDNRNGNIELRFSSPPKDDIDITNASAGISISMPENSNFQIVADCHSGDIDSEFESDSLKKTTTEGGDSHLEGRYGTGRAPKITLHTTYGSISIHKN